MRNQGPDNLNTAGNVDDDTLRRLEDLSGHAVGSVKSGFAAINEVREGDFVKVITCGGTACCSLGKQDSLELGLKLEDKYYKMALPAKFCIGVCGCSNRCAEACVRDIGIVGTLGGWNVFVGGCDHTRSTKLLAEEISTPQVLRLVDKTLKFYAANAPGGQLFLEFVESTDYNNFKAAVTGEFKKNCNDENRQGA